MRSLHGQGGSWKDEKGILEFFGAVRKAIEEAEGIDTIKTEVTTEMVRAPPLHSHS